MIRLGNLQQLSNYISETMNTGQKKYYQIVKDLQKQSKSLFSEDDSKKVYTALADKIKQIFKLQITFDATIVHAIIKRLEVEYENYYYEESFVRTLDFAKKFTKALAKEKFIGKRHQLFIENKINSYEQDPCYSYYNLLCYLRADSDKENFRLDFLYRYMNMKDEEEYEDWEDEDYQKVYRKFWKHLLMLNPKSRLVTYIYTCFCKYEDPTEMLTDDIIQKINERIGENMGKTEIQVELNKELKNMAIQNFYENSSEAKERINKQFEIIQTFLHKFKGTKKIEQEDLQLSVSKFGSLVSGFAGADSDLDITILTNCYVNENNFLLYLCEFLKIEFAEHDKKTGRTTKVQKIDASTSLVEVEIQGDRRQPKFKIDILVNNMLGVINSRFLSVYAQVPWIKQLGILFKVWSKTNGLVDKTLLSSYSIILMMINFLIKKNYVNLTYNANKRNQATPKINFKRIKSGVTEEFQVYYEFDNRVQNVTNLKSVDLVEILKELFLYYSMEGEHWKHNEGKNIISVDGTYNKDFDEDCAFTIKDPFDKPHNPGRAKVAQKDFFVNRFKHGHDALCELQKKGKKDERVNFLSKVFEKSE